MATNQPVTSLSSSYDGIWEGYTHAPEGRFYIDMEIINGIMSGIFEDTKIKGYIKADNNFFIRPFNFMGAQVILETNLLQLDALTQLFFENGKRF